MLSNGPDEKGVSYKKVNAANREAGNSSWNDQAMCYWGVCGKAGVVSGTVWEGFGDGLKDRSHLQLPQIR